MSNGAENCILLYTFILPEFFSLFAISLILRAESHRLAQLVCPACDVKLRPSNFNRHWANQHPGLPIPEKRTLKGYPGAGTPNGRTSLVEVDPSMVEFVQYENEDDEVAGDSDGEAQNE